ncbi:MAG: peaA [Gemmatimonadetes bacterium]|nr:peaA [Gemmatimonadota bacterium]
MRIRLSILGASLCLFAGISSEAQGPGRGNTAQKWPPVRRDTTPGFVIREPLVIQRCGECHKPDSAGRMERLSYLRKSPEGWEISIRRMAALVGVGLQPSDARTIAKYLSNEQGLAPEEARPARFDAERRQLDYRYTADARTEGTCRACHSMGRVISQRRTRDEWELLVATHRAYYPDVDRQTFRRNGFGTDTGANAQHPMDIAIAHLARAFPLRTNEWATWSATMRAPRVDGTWLLSGTEPGHGAFTGRLTITKSATADDEFTTHATYRYVDDGKTVTRDGKSVVYTGFQWRGRSNEVGMHADSAWREVMFIEPGWQSISGRWFKGGYDEFGMDVSLTRLSTGVPVVAAVTPRSLRAGSANQMLTIIGANLPAGLAANAIDFGPGVHVDRVVHSGGDSISVLVRVDSGATNGARDLFVAGASLRSASVVYDKVHRIRVTPQAGLARVGGVNFPKQFEQFEATAFNNGPDGKPETADDIEIGPVKAAWNLEEYSATFDDDDVKFVGAIDQNGKFTPNIDGPNTKRSGNRNNIGDVWAVATYQGMKARALLLVTVPLYLRWEPWKGAP